MSRKFDYLGDVEVFLAVVEHGSFTAGAVALSTTPSVLSRAVSFRFCLRSGDATTLTRPNVASVTVAAIRMGRISDSMKLSLRHDPHRS